MIRPYFYSPEWPIISHSLVTSLCISTKDTCRAKKSPSHFIFGKRTSFVLSLLWALQMDVDQINKQKLLVGDLNLVIIYLRTFFFRVFYFRVIPHKIFYLSFIVSHVDKNSILDMIKLYNEVQPYKCRRKDVTTDTTCYFSWACIFFGVKDYSSLRLSNPSLCSFPIIQD